MDFFDIGAGELLLVLIVAFIVMGPAKIVHVSRELGKIVYSFRKATTDLTTQITREIALEEKQTPPKAVEAPLPPPPEGKDQPGSDLK